MEVDAASLPSPVVKTEAAAPSADAAAAAAATPQESQAAAGTPPTHTPASTQQSQAATPSADNSSTTPATPLITVLDLLKKTVECVDVDARKDVFLRSADAQWTCLDAKASDRNYSVSLELGPGFVEPFPDEGAYRVDMTVLRGILGRVGDGGTCQIKYGEKPPSEGSPANDGSPENGGGAAKRRKMDDNDGIEDNQGVVILTFSGPKEELRAVRSEHDFENLGCYVRCLGNSVELTMCPLEFDDLLNRFGFFSRTLQVTAAGWSGVCFLAGNDYTGEAKKCCDGRGGYRVRGWQRVSADFWIPELRYCLRPLLNDATFASVTLHIYNSALVMEFPFVEDEGKKGALKILVNNYTPAPPNQHPVFPHTQMAPPNDRPESSSDDHQSARSDSQSPKYRVASVPPSSNPASLDSQKSVSPYSSCSPNYSPTSS